MPADETCQDYLAIYDISDPRRLQRIGKLMTGFGIRVQKSVFECLLSEVALQNMKQALKGLIDEEEDSVRIYPLLASSRKKQQILGQGVVYEFKQTVVL